jgi:thiamine pyrophosphate-dependent acetolactate synthase large subunit-like protein
VVVDFCVEPNEHVYPMVPSGKGLHEMEMGKGLHEMGTLS